VKETRFCKTCGRADENWRDRHSAVLAGTAKADFAGSNEDRLAAYRRWHRTLPVNLICTDVDQIEWRMRDGAFVPVAILEMSRIDGGPDLPKSYCEAVIDRMTVRDSQGSLALTVAAGLGVPAYVVLFHESLSVFYIYNLTHPAGWRKLPPGGYKKWLINL
jgi:hypothetical protein